jgi:hypothetical protein
VRRFTQRAAPDRDQCPPRRLPSPEANGFQSIPTTAFSILHALFFAADVLLILGVPAFFPFVKLFHPQAHHFH